MYNDVLIKNNNPVREVCLKINNLYMYMKKSELAWFVRQIIQNRSAFFIILFIYI